jgi:hypothetical protein
MPAAPFFAEPITQPTRQHAIEPEQCRWIIADEESGADALMCGAEAERRRSFCAAHCARAYIKPVEDEAVESEAEEKSEDEKREAAA